MGWCPALLGNGLTSQIHHPFGLLQRPLPRKPRRGSPSPTSLSNEIPVENVNYSYMDRNSNHFHSSAKNAVRTSRSRSTRMVAETE